MIVWAKCLKNNEILFRFLYLYNIYNSIVYIYRKREFLLAQFAIYFFVFEHHMALDSLHVFILLKPLS